MKTPGSSRFEPSPQASWNARLIAERARLKQLADPSITEELARATGTVDWDTAARLFKE